MPDATTHSARNVTILSIVMNLALAGGKIAAGVLFASQAILADGVHSLSDLITDAAVVVSLVLGDKPADPCHPYGHRRVHTLVSLFIGAALAAAAGLIVYRASIALQSPAQAITNYLPLAMAILTIPLKEYLYRRTRRIGLAVNNPALVANAWHHRTDSFSSLAVALGITGAMFLGPQWRHLDAITALLLGGVLLFGSGKMILVALAELTDQSPRREEIDHITELVATTPGVRGYHAVRARRLAGQLEMDVHILVDPDWTVVQGHAIAALVRRRVRDANLNVQEIIIHIEPDDGNHPPRTP